MPAEEGYFRACSRRCHRLIYLMTDSDNSRINPADKIKPFERRFWDGADTFTKIGNGAIGGKASGLALVRDILARRFQREQFPSLELNVPTLTVITTEFYDRFMQDNNLYGEILRDYRDDQIALIFQRGELAPELVGDLRALISNFHTPLAIRSSSLLEDAMREPFAGVYGTKMIPNNQPETDTRFQRLVEAIKFVYASTHFRKARNYLKSTRRAPSAEKMAVIIQEVVGRRHNGRFYPDISGVARSINHYPTGHATPEQGVVSLALGLGKTIVDGGQVWSYAPSYPRATPPVRSLANLAKMSQATFWAVNMGKPPAHDPIKETEYLVRLDLKDAEWDGTLALTASTYQPQNDRLVTGIGQEGIRVVTFAPLLSARLFPLNDLLRHLLQVSAEETGSDIEMEFAMTFSRENNSVKCRLGYLQLRPMATRDKEISLSNAEMQSEKVIVRSSQVMGNGIIEG
ncbi:MAG: PEP/pyruvate-binding domain-containing protein, partial [Candidatus Zixiibacteriota bacterium]